MIKLTERQRDVLLFVQGYIDTNGYPPSFRDIAKHFGFKSTSGVNDHLTALETKGYLALKVNKARSLRVLVRIEGGEPRPLPTCCARLLERFEAVANGMDALGYAPSADYVRHAIAEARRAH